MSKKPLSVDSIDDALIRLNSPHEGDSIVVQALPIIVPIPSYNLAITNAAMQLLMHESYNDNSPVSSELTLCEKGQYEVIVIFHVRRVGAIEYPILN